MTTLSGTDAVQQARLVELARMGDIQPLLEHLCELIGYRAHVLARGYHLEREDVLHEGIVNMLAEMRKALLANSPIAYLRAVATRRMKDYCMEQQCPIRVPASSQRCQGKKRPTVLSLDRPFRGHEDDGFSLLDVLQAESWRR